MSEKIHKAREVFKIKNNLLKVAPNICDVDIRINKTHGGKYKTQILVKVPAKTKLISSKIDESLSQSIEKAHKAIVKQIIKVNKQLFNRQTIRKQIFHEAA
jgi:ribosome-associated translation inhibitor RaiA